MKRLIVAATLAAGFGQTAHAEVPAVVTDIAPIHSLVAQVMGELGTPRLLIDGAADPHSFQLKPSQARSLASADLFIWVGPELTPSLDRAIAGTGVKGEALALLGHAHDDDHHEDEGDTHEAGESHAEHGGHDHEEHDHGGVDPHAWLDPVLARDWLEDIALHLGEQDPANAAAYAANALAAQSRIDAMMSNVEAILKDRKPGPVLVLHDAYDHFTDRFGIEVLGALKAGDHAAPSAAQIKALRDQVAAQPVACIFSEPHQDDRLIRAVVEGSDIGIGVLDPTGATLKPGPNLYETLILGMAASFTECDDPK